VPTKCFPAFYTEVFEYGRSLTLGCKCTKHAKIDRLLGGHQRQQIPCFLTVGHVIVTKSELACVYCV